jgi:MFS family permease
MKQRIITKAILVLSLVSLFTDIASEMLYPVMPLYLKSIGFSIVLIGVLEGFAEAITGLSKGYFGNLSDQMGRRVPFVRLGYFLSALSKPLLAILAFPLWVFIARTIDRLGKGIRTSARDALLSNESTKENKATVFGFHRAMDTLGATIGPLIALLWLYYNPGEYKILFIIAFFPGIIAVILTYILNEKPIRSEIEIKNYSFFNFLSYWKKSTPDYKKLIIGLLTFTLINSSDVFLLLMLKEKGFSDYDLIFVYIFYNLIYALFSYPLGSLADRFGLKKTFVLGLVLFGIVYGGMAINSNRVVFFVLFALYGIYAACTEGISKAWLSNISSKADAGTALGFYSSFNSIMTVLASSLAGIVWYKFSPESCFFVSAAGAGFVTIYFLIVKIKSH